MANISKITIPVGNSSVTYWLADEYVRQHLGVTGVGFTLAWDGSSAPVVANIPAGVTVKYQGTDYTGTLAASAAENLTFYLVYSGTQIDGKDVYDEYVVIGAKNSRTWEKIGDTAYDFSEFKALAFKDSIELAKGSGDTVLGASAQLQGTASDVTLKSGASDTKDSVLGSEAVLSGAQSAVTFTGGTSAHAMGADAVLTASSSSISWVNNEPITATANVMGADTEFETTMNDAKKYLKATASGFAIESAGSEADVVTSLTPATDSFVKGISKPTKKMVTTTISTVGDTTAASLVEQTAKKMELASVPHVDGVGSADTWSFTYDSTNHKLVIAGANGTALSLSNSNDTVATGQLLASGDTGYENAGAEIVASVTATEKTVATKATNDTVVATGALIDSSATGYSEETGASIVTGVTYAGNDQTADALTGVTAVMTEDALTGVQVASQPTVALSLENASDTGTVEVLTGVSNAQTSIKTADVVAGATQIGTATAAGQAITVSDSDDTTIVATIGNGTAAAQTISVTKDATDVVTALGAREAAGQTISVSSADSKKVAKYSDLDVVIS